MMQKLIRELQVGEAVENFYVYISDVKHAVTQTGSPYANIFCSDRSTSIRGVMWNDRFGEIFDQIVPKSFAIVDAKIGLYRDAPNFELTKFTIIDKLPDELVLLFERIANIDVENYKLRLRNYLESFANPIIANLAKYIFYQARGGKIFDLFCEAPGAAAMHHAYKHGLLEHSINICDGTALLLTSPYYGKLVDRDEVIFGILMHDIGKIWQYKKNGFDYEYTSPGNMLGHIVIGLMLLDEAARALNIPNELRMRLLHTLAAHHGQLEWGSPVMPQTAEAFLVHTMENFDSKMVAFKDAVENRVGNSPFSDYQKTLGVRIFYGDKKPD